MNITLFILFPYEYYNLKCNPKCNPKCNLNCNLKCNLKCNPNCNLKCNLNDAIVIRKHYYDCIIEIDICIKIVFMNV